MQPDPSIHSPEVLANHQQLQEREAHLRQYGCDLSAGIAFVLAQALPLPAEGPVLEIGTGKGRFLVELAKHVSRVTTVDVSAEEQQCARLNARYAGVERKIEFVVQDATRLPWADQTFKAVVTMNAMHHIRDVHRVMEEILRVVEPGGKVVLADFAPRGFRRLERAHRAEGKVHSREIHHFADLRKIFRDRGWATRLRKGCNQEVLVACCPPALG